MQEVPPPPIINVEEVNQDVAVVEEYTPLEEFSSEMKHHKV